MLTVKFCAQPTPLKCYSGIEGHPGDASLFSKNFLLELPLVFLYISYVTGANFTVTTLVKSLLSWV